MLEHELKVFYGGDIEAAKRAHALRPRPISHPIAHHAAPAPHPDDADLSARFAGWYAGDLQFVNEQLH